MCKWQHFGTRGFSALSLNGYSFKCPKMTHMCAQSEENIKTNNVIAYTNLHYHKKLLQIVLYVRCEECKVTFSDLLFVENVNPSSKKTLFIDPFSRGNPVCRLPFLKEKLLVDSLF